MPLRNHIRRFVPLSLWQWLKDLKAAGAHFVLADYDRRRYAAYSGIAKGRQTIAHEDAEITKLYHSLEKGLSLPQPRTGFGTTRADLLIDLLLKRLRSGGEWTAACRHAAVALQSHAAHAIGHGRQANPRLADLEAVALAGGVSWEGSAVKAVRRADVLAAVDFDAERFFNARHSIRDFAAAPLDRDRLRAAVELAKTAPSVCNRQAARIVVVTNEGRNFELLRHQNGNRGFGSSASAFLVVLSDLRSFVDPEERYQAWIDGGMFAMSLVLALHSKGFGTCCLNWSNSAGSDKAFRAEAGIPDHETIIMLMAVGELPDDLLVASSERLPTEEILRYLEVADPLHASPSTLGKPSSSRTVSSS